MLAEKNKRFDSPQTLSLFFIVCVVILSSIFNRWLGGGIISAQYFITALLIPFILVSNTINTLLKQKIVIIFLIIAALIMVNNGISQKVSDNGIGWSGAELSQGTRITYLGIFNDPNDLGMFLVMTIPLVIAMFSLGKTVFRYVYLGALFYIVYGVYLTNSRGALLGLFGLIFSWFYKRFGVKLTLIAGGAVLPIAYVVMSMFRTIDSEEASAAGRLNAWYEGFQMLFHNPLFGVGMGQFVEEHGLTAHNSFVLVWSELGLLGYFLWVTFIVYTWMSVYRIWGDNSETSISTVKEESLIAKAFSFSIIGFMITACFLSRSYSPIFYLFCGMCLASHYRFEKITSEPSDFNYGKYSKLVWYAFAGSLLIVYVAVKILV